MTAYVNKAVYAIGQAASGITAIIGSRMYPIVLPQDGTLPAIVYRQTGGEVVQAMGGSPGLKRKMIQLLALSPDVSQMRQIVEEIRIAYDRYRGTIAGVSINDIFVSDVGAEGYDDTLQVFYGSVDLTIWHEG